MPQDVTSGKPNAKKRAGMPRVRSHTDAELHYYREQQEDVLPSQFRVRLHEWFEHIEKEFEALYAQNIALQQKVDRLERESNATEKIQIDTDADVGHGKPVQKVKCNTTILASDPLILKIDSLLKAGGVSNFQKAKAANKLRVQTSKIVSSFKPASITCLTMKVYSGHKDGVWDVAVSRRDQPVIASASADQTANVWGIESGKCLLQYAGHSGSVNSVKFHPCQDLIVTASGDHTAHIWQAAITPDQLRVHSSEDEVDGSEHEDEDDWGGRVTGSIGSSTLRTPLKELTGHSNVVIAADWLPGGEHVITASWDRTANLYDAITGETVSQLIGHDQELTHCCSHPTQRLVVTASKDTTFRLWDFRETIHSVSVFQGHSESVTSVCFTREDKVVSGSDDRTVKVWDVKNMRSPLATIRLDSAVNRLAVSSANIIAIPHDNRQVRLYDLAGQRLGRLPRSGRQGHRRIVCGVAWADDVPTCNLFTAGFDRIICGWSVQPIKD